MDSLIAQEQKTAKNGLTFTGSEVSSGANNRGHTHEYTPSGKIASTSGGTDNKTAGMSANATGHMYVNYTGGFGNIEVTDVNPFDGNLSSSTKASDNYAQAATGTSNKCLNTLTVDVSHTHTAYFTGSKASTLGESQNHTHSVTAAGTISGDSETRPVNYTMKIWKRIA